MQPVGIERPGGPYAAQMIAGGAWPEADEGTYFHRADELRGHHKQITGALEDWQRHETLLFNDSHAWSGDAARAAARHIGRITEAVHTHQKQLTTAISQANAAAAVLVWAKEQITANVEHAHAEIARINGLAEFTPSQKAYFTQGTISTTQRANLAVIDAGVAKLGPTPTPTPNVRLVSNGHRLPQAPAIDNPLSKPIPDDPQQFHEYWQNLSQAQKDALYARDPSIGNHPGMPVDPSDHRGSDWYNRRHLTDELAQARAADARAEALKAAHPDWAAGKNVPKPNIPGAIFKDRLDYEKWQRQYDAARNDARYLPDLQAVQRAAEPPGRKLMLLDTESGRQAHAAIAIGNPDTADHVSVTTPGLNTTVHGAIGGMTEEAMHLRDESLNQLGRLGRGDESVSTIAWIGYDTPQIPGMHAAGSSLAGGWDVSHDSMARAGAHNLARFYDGLQAAHEGAPAQVTAIGHSYGSLTTGLALQEPGNHGITDAIFYGSPGIEASTPAQLQLQPGHVYAMEAPDDPIQWTYDSRSVVQGIPIVGSYANSEFGDFGPNPATNPNFTHLTTAPTAVPDGRFLEGASGHSEYPQLGDNGELRISGYNLAAVLAGLGDRAVTE